MYWRVSCSKSGRTNRIFFFRFIKKFGGAKQTSLNLGKTDCH